MNRKKIKNEAKELIRNNLWKILKPYLFVSIMTFIIVSMGPEAKNENLYLTFSIILNIFLYPLYIGLNSFILKVIRKNEFDYKEVFNYYSKFIYVAGLCIIISIVVSFWTLLFIIPGIIFAISYTMAPYFMADGIEDPIECIKESKALMRGYKWDYFKFIFSFFWWCLIIPVAFWYVIPYIRVSEALYYEELKKFVNF